MGIGRRTLGIRAEEPLCPHPQPLSYGVGELRAVEADAGLGEGAERDEGEQEPVESVELRRCECVLEVLHQRCDRVLFCRVVPFGCYHSG